MKATPQARRFSLFAIVALLMLVGFGQSFHRHDAYDVPWFPGTEKSIWSIEATIQFFARGDSVSVNLRRPGDQNGFAILDESGASQGYGLSFANLDGQPTAQWSVREARGRQTLYYRAEVLQREGGDYQEIAPPQVISQSWEEPYATAVKAVLDEAFSLSADSFSLTRQLISQFRDNNRAQNEQLLLDAVGEPNLTNLLANMLQSRDIPATTVYGLLLEDGRRRQSLKPLLRVWSEDRSEIFPLDFNAAESNLPLLLWQPTRGFVLDVTGGSGSDLSFAMIRSGITNYGQVANALSEDSDWLGFSIHALPIEEQAVFKTILLLPIGALVVCLLRILVGTNFRHVHARIDRAGTDRNQPRHRAGRVFADSRGRPYDQKLPFSPEPAARRTNFGRHYHRDSDYRRIQRVQLSIWPD